MTKVAESSSFGQIDPLNGNGHVPDGVHPDPSNVNSCEEGEMKIGEFQAALEHSTFGIILNSAGSYGNDAHVGASTGRPERLKIIVKRKVVPDESGRETLAKSPMKKLKVDTIGVGDNEGVELDVKPSTGSLTPKSTTPTGSSLLGVAQHSPEFSSEQFGIEGGVAGQSHGLDNDITNKITSIPGDSSCQTHTDGLVLNRGDIRTSPTSFVEEKFSLVQSSELLPSFSSSLQSRFEKHSGPSTFPSPALECGKSLFSLPVSGVVGQSMSGVYTSEERLSKNDPDGSEAGSPIVRSNSGGAPEHAYTPKARRTPLFFPPSERTVEDIVLSSPSQSSNPPALPAKRSPLPLPGGSSSEILQHHAEKTVFEGYIQNPVNAGDQLLSEGVPGLDSFQGQFSDRMGKIEADDNIEEECTSYEEEGDAMTGEADNFYGAEAEEELEEDDEEEEEYEEEEEDNDNDNVGTEFEEMVELKADDGGPQGLDDEDLVDDDFVSGLKFDIAELDHDDQHIETTSGCAIDDGHIFRETFTVSEKSESSLQYDAPYITAPLLHSSSLGDSRFSFQSLINGNPYPLDKDENDPESVFQDRNLDQVDDPDQGGSINSEEEEGDSPEENSLSPEPYYPSVQVFEESMKAERHLKVQRLDSSHKSYSAVEVDDWKLKGFSTTAPTHTSSQRAQPSSGLKRLKVKMSSDISVKQAPPAPARAFPLKDAPTTAKALLATGLLEGYRVKYLDRSGGVMLTGRIKDSGISCDCIKCKGQQVINVSAFEKHAGSSARHPSDFIFLENGKNLHDVMEAGWKAGVNPKKVLEALQLAMGLSVGIKDSICCVECGTGGTLINCSGPRCPGAYHIECAGLSQAPEGDWLCGLCGSAENRKRLLKANSTLSRESSTGKQDSSANMHKALFLPGALPDDIEVGYFVKGKHYLTGVKKGGGICCSCCNTVVSCSQFEQHAGWGSRRNPYSSIYLKDGRSLHCAALALSNTWNETPAENIDHCTECADGGDLVLCDGCPGAYHPECAGLLGVPEGRWFCSRCKTQQGSISGSAPKSKKRVKGGSKSGALTAKENSDDDRCTRLLKATDTVSSGCVYCRSGEFAKSGFGPRTILLCDQCEREFHVGCLKEHGLANLTELPDGEWFCEKDCQHIHGILHLLVANGMEPLAGSIVSKVIENKTHGEGSEIQQPSRFSWQLLHGRRGDPQNGKTLTEAAAIFSESFDPIVDESSGRDLIPLMVHSRSIRDQDFGGMHCVVLKRNDEVVTAALVRIFGRQFAELPLVATRVGNHGQGYCKALILSIERLLGVLNVERLVLPAAEGAEGIWVKKFGFSQLSDEESRRFRSEVQMMIFKGSSLLKKVITPMAIQ